MQSGILIIVFVMLLTNTFQLSAKYNPEDSTYKKYFVGSTLFLLSNLYSKNSPGFVQLNVGYRKTGKDVVSLELITWK